ncbi:DinI family protein [Salmonella enterica subsp. enterica]|nr:DinI family protein [Salmonella enterica]ECC3607256.1 DinI family protein [Salmonella enterica subsp. enterica]EGI6197713.1 DinI family protein [Salmonella enterica subsp. enterica serovar Eastbourne]ECE0940222.1 DinI family protein [Salmonella enterica subsp. enterica]ECH9416589.1 DinI family protein [Salmonella enterica subsp. enterica]
MPGAKDIILGKLRKKVHRIFPDADFPFCSGCTDSSKHEKEQISPTVQEMFEEADMWLVSD